MPVTLEEETIYLRSRQLYIDFRHKVYLRTCRFTNGGFKKEGKDIIFAKMSGTYL